jgi:hypothetical protein
MADGEMNRVTNRLRLVVIRERELSVLAEFTTDRAISGTSTRRVKPGGGPPDTRTGDGLG